MKFLFVSNQCFACTENFVKFILDSYSDINVVYVEYDPGKKKYLAYRDNEQIGSESPVSSTPTMFFEDTGEVYSGKAEIIKKLREDARK